MAEAKGRGGIVQFLLLFLAIYFATQLVFGLLFPSKDQTAVQPGSHLSVGSVSIGNHPIVSLENIPTKSQSFGVSGFIRSWWCRFQRVFTGTPETEQCRALAEVHDGQTFTIAARCPNPPFDVFIVEIADAPEKLTPLTATETAMECPKTTAVPPGETVTFSLGPWKYAMFERVGTFEVRLPGTPSGTGALASGTAARFSISEPGVFTKTFRTFITKPFLNFLVFAASITPGHNLGVAIIVLTLLVKILLFFPTQHALEGQKKMQMLQPKLEELKRRFKDDSKRLQEETMKLWKEHNINPFSSCLPLVIQFPILIGVFYVVRDSADLVLSRHLMYGFYQNLPWDFGTNFLWLDLLKPDLFILPITLGVMQFLQMKLSFSIQKRKKRKEERSREPSKEPASASPEKMQQNLMLYGLPLMITFFAFQFPSAVSLYWGVSTIFGIGQQMIVNREHLRV